jgi:hypothetical protein
MSSSLSSLLSIFPSPPEGAGALNSPGDKCFHPTNAKSIRDLVWASQEALWKFICDGCQQTPKSSSSDIVTEHNDTTELDSSRIQKDAPSEKLEPLSLDSVNQDMLFGVNVMAMIHPIITNDVSEYLNQIDKLESPLRDVFLSTFVHFSGDSVRNVEAFANVTKGL